ncbi:MAG: 16S rRNA (guanine(966)-N(2))-methyltransferase RsmD [Planctomycetota bacterium]
MARGGAARGGGARGGGARGSGGPGGGLRITGGELRGRALLTPPGEDLLRPMRSQVRQALFNVLAAETPGAAALDLFAGSGCLGIEALSRGARRCTFVERAGPCLKVLERNLDALGLAERGEVRRHDLNLGLGALASAGPFDLVLVHPPFELLGRAEQPSQPLDVAALLSSIPRTPGLLAPEGTVAFETPRGCYPDPAAALPGLRIVRQKDYGTTTLFVAVRAEDSSLPAGPAEPGA